MTEEGVLSSALKVTFPVLLGYIPMGIAFGLLLVDTGYPWWTAPIVSLVVFAGAAQYVMVALLAAGAGLVELAVTTLMINMRHMFYGISLLDRYSDCGRWRPYLFFALTDETYALLTSTGTPEGVDSTRYLVCVSMLDHSYWVIGSLIGAVLGSMITMDLTGIAFVMTALFVVLAIEQWYACGDPLPFVVGTASGILALLLLGPDNMLLASMMVGAAVLLAYQRLAPSATKGGAP